MIAQELYAPVHLTASGAAKVGPGVLHSVSINTKGATASVVTVYDSLTASGTVIAIIDSLTFLGSLIYDVSFSIGCFISITGGADVTASVANIG